LYIYEVIFKDFRNFKPPEIEEKILKFWQEKKIFEKSLRRAPASVKTTAGRQGKSPKGEFIFYDGPPFATGLPHYGHILASIIKDVVPRYQTMKGKCVPRRWGWDCHGLPIENEIEKELGFKTKKDIEKFGVGNFNEKARSSVLRYADEWKKIIPRIGRWVDMEDDYKTMDADYTESVWWAFKKLDELGLVYNAYRVAPYCPRCGTPLSNFELNQPDAYRDVKDQSVYVKFRLQNQKSKIPTYFLVWTTTPWTLPGNVALAVGLKIDYVKISHQKENLILAEKRLSVINGEYKILEKYKGKDLIGQKYEPLYKIKLDKPAYRAAGADFVSVEDGTGIVHIAPAFGEEDMNLGRQEKLPVAITVDLEGKIMKGLGLPGEGVFVKKADEEIKKDLKNKKLLYKEEEIVHSYPHCWRCDTPLLYYPVNSWYVAVTKIKKHLIRNNSKINWVPAHVKNGRFGKWLGGVRDWDVARTRFWGAALPVWQCQSCKKHIFIGSVKELGKKAVSSGNKYFILRHAEADSNILNINSCWPEKTEIKLTERGKKQAEKVAEQMKNKKIDLIFASDLQRTKETAGTVAKKLHLTVKFDKRIREYNLGIFNGETMEKFSEFIGQQQINKFTKTPKNGENLNDIRKRMVGFILELERKYKNKNILIVSHGDPLWVLEGAVRGLNDKKIVETRKNYIQLGEWRQIENPNLPYNKNGQLDLHRPYIDKIKLGCGNCGGLAARVSQVFDCWFESGSMPYGQTHYPFENKIFFEKNFPAEFIAEGIDQTRGWFYTLLVLSSALFNKPAFKNVIVNGIVLAENGQKMSKRLKNYPDPMDIINRYGADALRIYLLSSPAVKAENLNFSEKGVDEIYKKTVMRLFNVLSFYELYAGKKPKTKNQKLITNNFLDKWILARLNQLINEVSRAMEAYELDKAVRPINDFVDDLSTWYIRRSRERFKNEGRDKQSAVLTTKFILEEFSKIMAPFAPFIAEAIYKSLQNTNSVHLENWPKANKKLIDKNLLISMTNVRKIASLALEARTKAGIKVRQPLQKLKVKSLKFKVDKDLLDILKDEVNFKEIIFDNKIKDEIKLDTKITPGLKAEGQLRELIRIVQDLRKEAGYTPKDKIYLWLEVPEEIKSAVAKSLKNFKEKVGAKNIEFRRADKFDAESETKIDGKTIWLRIKKV